MSISVAFVCAAVV